MSIKTLRKRIALVAVSALGVGLLSVAPANAGTTAAGDITIQAPAAGVNSTLVCLAGAGTAAIPYVVGVGGTLQFSVNTPLSGDASEDAKAVITGLADWTATTPTSYLTVDASGKAADLTNIPVAGRQILVMSVKGAGNITVDFYSGTPATSSNYLSTYYITAVSSCTTGVSAANSFVQVSDSSTKIDTAANWISRQTSTSQSTATTTMTSNADLDTSLDVRTDFSNTQEAYIAVRARDAYKANISEVEDNLLTVVCDGGARVNNTAYNFFSDATWNSSTYEENNIAVSQAKDGVASTSVCTVSVNGVELAKKTIKWAGDLASITIAESRIGEYGDTSNTAGRITYTCKDAAGNAISCAIGTTSNNHTGVSNVTLTAGSGGTMVTSVAEYSSSTYAGQAFGFGANPYTKGTGYATFTCYDYGNKDITVYGYSAAGALVTSNKANVKCEDAYIYTYTASLDKATYKKGDVATLTIVAKGSNGTFTAYGTELGGNGAISVAMPGMTAVTAPSNVDTESTARAGEWIYTYTVDSDAEGNYNAAVKIPVSSTTSPQYGKAVTVAYTVQGSGGVSNAEVLAAIVKLIASINKQIRALQKSIKR